MSRASTYSSISFAPTPSPSEQRRASVASSHASGAREATEYARKYQLRHKLPARPVVPPKPVDACAWTFAAVRQYQAEGSLADALDFARFGKRQAEALSRSQRNSLKHELMPSLLVSTLIANDRRTFELLNMSDANFITPGGVKEALGNKLLQQSPSPLLRQFFQAWSTQAILAMAGQQSVFHVSSWRSQRPEDRLSRAEKKLTHKLVPTVLDSHSPAFIIALAGSKATAQSWAKQFGHGALSARIAAHTEQS